MAFFFPAKNNPFKGYELSIEDTLSMLDFPALIEVAGILSACGRGMQLSAYRTQGAQRSPARRSRSRKKRHETVCRKKEEEEKMIKGRIVDLSHKMYPGKEEYGLELVTHFTDELMPQYKRDEDVWYILQDIRMSSHCGTHIEFPYHHKKDGLDAGSFPLKRLIGDCLLLDFTHKQPGDAVTLEDLGERRQKIQEGDMLLFNFNCSRFYYTERAHDRPYITTDAVRWLVLEKKISLIGSDASGIEVKGIPNQPNHQFLMDHNVPIIEFAAHFDELRKERFTLFALALRIERLDSCPVRLIAIEDE